VRRPEILLVVEILGGGPLREWALPVDRDEFESGEVAVAGLAAAAGEVEAEGGCGSGCWERRWERMMGWTAAWSCRRG